MQNISAILMSYVLPLALVFAVFYFLVMLPDKKRRKKYDEMLSSLKVDSNVVTRGGIIGKITYVDDKTVTLETSPAKTKIKVQKNGIAHILAKEE
ncbi:preprotein translocase subunit YajC [Clostridium sp. BJN0001]|uniref:preprotein translocase subunit YajC n=1 Tax=Clostridium sp. BJN0001 TaxID=2930219 RepID=UPI001FD20BF2|nr:preprotein translocase subunit YajC [Clostridium sp. BJN0001]